MTRPAFLENSLLVVAHPDDELLWFGAILHQVDRVIMVFENFWPDPDIGPARARVLERFPRNDVTSLRMEEAASYGCADWRNPQLTPFGIAFSQKAQLRDAKQKAKRLLGKSLAPRVGITGLYEENFKTLVDQLRPQLTSKSNVFTHNPWGEYGHEDHIQVFRALDTLRREIGFSLWMSNYCTERSLPLAMTYFDTAEQSAIQLPVNKSFADRVAHVYREAGCWTWSDSWVWFDSEHYMRAPTGQICDGTIERTQRHLFPLNLFNIDPVRALS